MTDPISLDDAAASIAEMVEGEGYTLDEEAMQDLLEELPEEVAEELLNATDPGGLVDALNEMDLDLLE